MTHSTMKTFASLLLVSLGTLFSSISSGFAQEIKAPPVQPVWEPWNKKTLQLQLLVIPAAIGVGAANGFFSQYVYPSKFKKTDILHKDGDFEWISAVFGYTLSQGLLIGAVGDAMGGDGGFAAPIAAGFLMPSAWIMMLGLMDLRPDDAESIPVIVTTTFVAQLVTYHLSASFFDDEPSALSSFGFGLAPTDGGASLGLGFQF